MMNEILVKRILEAVRCCREDECDRCPLQLDICDEFPVEMELLPSELIDRIGDALEEALKRKQ